MLVDSSLLQAKPVRIIPHVVDSLLLLTALVMLFLSDWSVLTDSWLQVKLLALLIYIVLGMLALRFVKRKVFRLASWLLALLVFAYMVMVALYKTPLVLAAI